MSRRRWERLWPRPYALRKRSYAVRDWVYDNPSKVVRKKRGRPRK